MAGARSAAQSSCSDRLNYHSKASIAQRAENTIKLFIVVHDVNRNCNQSYFIYKTTSSMLVVIYHTLFQFDVCNSPGVCCIRTEQVFMCKFIV